MCNLKLIAFNMLESVEGIPSARELVGILRGEIPEGEREAVINQLRLFGLPLTRIGLRRMLGTERQAELRRSFRGSSPQEIMTKLADMFYGGEFLQELLGREEEASKKAAAWWLGEIGDFADALGTLYNLIGDTQVELGNIAAEAYMKIEGRRGGIDGIRSHLNHEKSSIRAACAKTLKEVGTAQDLEPLQQRLQVEGLPNLRIALGEAFAWATFREKGIAAVRTFIFNACEQICAGVAQVLGEYGEPGEDIGRLRDWLGLKFRSVYCPQFAQAVVVLTEKESGLDGVRELLTDSNVHIRKAAAERMGEIGDIGDIERLGLRLWGQSREQESEVRKAAGDAIVSILKRQEPAGLDEALVRNSATLGFLVREYQAEDVGVSREIAKMIQVGGHAIYQGDWESILSVGAPSHDRELCRVAGEALVRIHTKTGGLPHLRALLDRPDGELSPHKRGAVKLLGEMGEAQDVQTLSGRYDPLADEEWNGSIVESMARITYRIGGIEAMRLLLTPGRAAGYTRVGAAKVLSEVAGVSALPLLEESLMTETEVEVADAIGVAILRICQREECLDEVVSISERTQKPTVASAFMLEYANV